MLVIMMLMMVMCESAGVHLLHLTIWLRWDGDGHDDAEDGGHVVGEDGQDDAEDGYDDAQDGHDDTEDDGHIGHAGYYYVVDGHVSHDDGRYDCHDCVGVLFKLSKVVEMAEK